MSEPASRPLAGYTIGITGHRRWEEQAEMLSRRGARVVHGPTMATTLLGDLDETVAVTRRVLEAPVDVVVLTTGIGTRSWFAAAESVGLDDDLRAALNASRVVVRGPKALHAARAEGLNVTWSAPSETNREVVANLAAAGVSGQRIAVQRDGGEPVVAAALRDVGAHEVIDVPVYRWSMPPDPAPALRLLDLAVQGQLDAVTFTSAHAVHNAFELAPSPGALAEAFNRHTVAVAVGPVTAQALHEAGVETVLEPERARLGSMVLAVAKALTAKARRLDFGGVSVRWQGHVIVDPDGELTELTPGERRLLEILVARAPSVVAKASLAEPGADDHAVEAAVARLRAKLGALGAGIRTVRRRGYSSELHATPA